MSTTISLSGKRILITGGARGLGRAFAEEAIHRPWFANLGRPLDREEKALARSYLDGLGFPGGNPRPPEK